MRASIIVSAFIIFFVAFATAVLAWNHQQNSASEQAVNDPILADVNPADDSTVSSPQSPTASPQATEAEQPGKQPPTEAVLKEIESIRRQIGIKLFPNDPEGTEGRPSQDFQDALKSLISKDSRGGEPAGTPQLPHAAQQNSPRNSSGPRPLQDPALNAQVTSALQAAIHALEQRAALAEERRQYDTSDRSRRLAHRLRKEIRTFQEGPSR